jgi:NADH-quinone oxidoreductase subunit J
MHSAFLEAVFFYVFSGLTVISALFVILQSNAVRSVLFLIATFLFSAVLWMLLHAEFLSLILVLVYVGAVMTLFLFVVMMLNIDLTSVGRYVKKYLPIALVILAAFVGLLKLVCDNADNIVMHNASLASQVSTNQNVILEKDKTSDIEKIGMVLYTDYAFALELAAMILLVAMVTSIALAQRKTSNFKKQNITKQIMTESKNRVKLVSINAEKY